MTSAWDRLMTAIDHTAAQAGETADLTALAALVAAAQAEGEVDRELDPAETARIMSAMLTGLATLPQPNPETDLATARLAITRWLHPARMDR